VVQELQIGGTSVRNAATADRTRRGSRPQRGEAPRCYDGGVQTQAGEPCMANIQSTPSKLVLKDRSTTITFDKTIGSTTLQQRILLWSRKPVQFPLDEIDDIAVKSEKDGLSGASIYHAVLHRRSGEVTVLTTEEAKDAEATVEALRDFVGLPH
jgi:hypothetical protein